MTRPPVLSLTQFGCIVWTYLHRWAVPHISFNKWIRANALFSSSMARPAVRARHRARAAKTRPLCSCQERVVRTLDYSACAARDLISPNFVGIPFAGVKRSFMITEGRLLELQSVRPAAPSSWFIDLSVKSDGGIMVASPYDPVFLMLPPLEQNAGRMSPLYQYLRADAGNSAGDLSALLAVSGFHDRLAAVCDVEEGIMPGTDNMMYRLNTAKAVAWLSHRVRRTAMTLSRQSQRAESEARASAAASFSATSAAAASTVGATTAAAEGAADQQDASLWQVPSDAEIEAAVAAHSIPLSHLATAMSIVGEQLSDSLARATCEACG
jgi:hypothetical protein